MFDVTKTKAVLWDFDDTLYSRTEAARKTFPGMFKEHLYPNGSTEFIQEATSYMMTKVKRNSMIHEEAFNALLEKYPPDKPYVRSDCLEYYYEHLWKYVVPLPQQLEVIKKLHSLGVKNAIVTNAAADIVYSQKRKITTYGNAELFDAVVISGELGIHKPDRGIYDHTAKLLGVTNSQCIFVGDDPDSDVKGAINADMEIVWLDKHEYDGRFSQDRRVHRVTSIKEYFEPIFKM